MWWREPKMTGPAALADAARRADVLTEWFTDEDDDSGQPSIIVEAHGGPWMIRPGPMGWWAVQAIAADGGGWWQIPNTAGWLGTGDLEPEYVVSNLLTAAELPESWSPGYGKVPTTRVPDVEAHARLDAADAASR